MKQDSPRRAFVVSVDEQGEQIDQGKWVNIPRPDIVDSFGLNHIAAYVDRLVNFASPRCSLIIASPEGGKACLIMRDADSLKVMEMIPAEPSSHEGKGHFRELNFPAPAAQPEKEAAVRKLFAELNLAPVYDQLHDANGYENGMRHLHYVISNDVDQATLIIQRLLREVYHVEEADGLNFTCSGMDWLAIQE
jgi:hypothetical protein